MKRIVLFSLMLILVTVNLYKTEARKVKPAEGTTTLASPESVFSNSFIPRDVAIGSSKKNPLFYVLNAERQIVVYNSSHKPVQLLIPRLTSPDAIAVDSAGQLYVADANANRIDILTPKGEIIRTLSAYRPLSLAVLNNGNIVVASPSNGQLLRVYDSSGQVVNSFGNLRQFESASDAENNFLNRGKVLVDSADTIYFVYTFAPVPMAQHYSAKGKLLSEFTINGDAIDVQLEPAKEFLKKRAPTKIGGINVINSASIDSETGHLWIGMNGSTDAGVLYEYKPNGKKLQEYRLLAGASYPTRAISGVGHVVVRTPSVYVFTAHGTLRFDLNRTMLDDGGTVYAEELCAQENPPDGCKTTCGTTDPADDKDCREELMSSVNTSGRRIIYSSCNSIPSSCHFQITLCKIATGVQTTHDVSLNCGGSSGGGGGDECAQIDCSVWLFPEGYTGTCCMSPIVIDILGNGFDLTDASHGVGFDLNSDGSADHLSWTAANSDDAFLALDRNANGAIDNGTELFGNFTPQPQSTSRNGFAALAEYDKPLNGGNGDGRIDYRDAVFSSLRLWQDANHNGISEAGELHTLPERNVTAIDLDYMESRRTDPFGNQFRYRAKVYDAHGARVGRWAWDVFLVSR